MGFRPLDAGGDAAARRPYPKTMREVGTVRCAVLRRMQRRNPDMDRDWTRAVMPQRRCSH